MKRVLHVSDAKSIHTRRWAEYQRDQGQDVHVASFRDEEIPGVSVHVLPTFGLGRAGYLFAVPSLRALARRVRPDVVHAQYVTSYGFVAALARLHPLVLTAWGTDVLISPGESRLMRWIAGYAVRHADAVTTVAQHMNAAVEALGAPADEVTAVPFGVDSRVFRPRAAARRADGILHIICTRNFGRIYDVRTLVSALGRLAGEALAFQADLVGDGPLRDELECQVRRAGLVDRVRFHGHVLHERLAELLAGADIFVTPALSDGNNVSLNEAMACGCFPIATDIPANSQWIDEGVNGLLYPPGGEAELARCLRRAAGDGALRQRAAAINRSIVEQRADWRVCVSRMEDIYVRAIGRARGAAP